MRLIITSSHGKQEHRLSEGITIVGRDPRCHLTITDPSLSRRHLECALEGGQLTVRDLNSKNGTYVGSQRVKEARVPPGITLRAGNVSIYVDAEEPFAGSLRPHPQPAAPGKPEAQTPEAADYLVEEERTAPAPAEAPADLDEIPDAAGYSEDDEPTPVDDSVAASAATDAAEAGTRLVVRDNRWFVQDPASGTEVEIVPVGQAGEQPPPATSDQPQANLPVPIAPATALVPRGLPAVPATAGEVEPSVSRPGPSKRLWLFLAVVAVAMIGATSYLWLAAEDETETLPLRSYRAEVNAALQDFRNGKRDLAARKLQVLEKQRVSGNPVLAQILLDAFEADGRLLAPAGFRESWEDAQARWEEARDSSESTPAAQDLAGDRLDWVLRESENMACANDANRLFKSGKTAAALKRADAVDLDSLFREEAEALIANAQKTVIAAATERAKAAERAGRWTEAITAWRIVLKHQPEAAPRLRPKIETFHKYETEGRLLEEAKRLARERKYDQALAKLTGIGDGSPYKSEAALFRRTCLDQRADYRGLSAYQSGNGPRALRILAEAGRKSTRNYTKIQAVVESMAEAQDALKAADFPAARTALTKIGQLESDRNNWYAREAQRILKEMPNRAADVAARLFAEAEADVRKRRFGEARRKYEKVLELDPSKGREVAARLGNLRRDAERDYNFALQLWRSQPDKATRLLEEVKLRVPPTDSYYRKADVLILKIKTAQK